MSSRSCSRAARDGRAGGDHRVIATILSVGIGVTPASSAACRRAAELLMNVFIVLPALPLLIIVLGFLPRSDGELPTADRPQRTRLGVGSEGDPCPDADATRSRFHRGGARNRREHLANRGVRAAAERGQSDRGELRRGLPLRDPDIGGAGVHRTRQRLVLEPRCDALLGAIRGRLQQRCVVVVPTARPGCRAARDEPRAAQLRARRARQPAPARGTHARTAAEKQAQPRAPPSPWRPTDPTPVERMEPSS